MADRRIRDELFQIRLHHRYQRAVNNADDRQHRDPACRTPRSLREERQAEANHAVGAHLQQHARQHHRAGRGRFHVRIRQPGVQREKRHLDRKSEEERQEEEHLGSWRELKAALRDRRVQQRLNRGQIKCARSVVEPDDADQHEDRAGHGEEHKLHRGIDAALVAPDADQQGHRNQHHFPEKEKEEKVQRQKYADNADFQHQQHHEKFFDAMLDALPRSQDGDGRQESRQDDEEQTDSINAQVIINRGLVDPLEVFLQVITGCANRHYANHQEREQKFSQRNNQRDDANEFVIVTAQQQKRQRSHRREENHHGKQVSAMQHQRTNPRTGFPFAGQKKMTAMITIAPTTTHTA